MTDISETIISIVQDTLRNISSDSELVVGMHDSMQTLASWDSLTFMAVYTAVNDYFSITPDFDDAIHYISVKSLIDFVSSKLQKNAA